MNISRAEQSAIKHNQEQYRLDQARMEKQREQDYAKKIEERRLDQIIAEVGEDPADWLEVFYEKSGEI